MSELNIYQRINAIMKDESIYLKKGSAGQGTGAQYDELIAVLAPKLAAHGIVVTTDKVGDSRCRETKKGAYIFECDYKVTYINIDNPEDRIETVVESHAQDGGDKAPGKATTYATKTSMLKVFGIETGDNEESRAEIADKSNTLSQLQISEIYPLVTESDDNGVAQWNKLAGMIFTAYKISSIEQLPASKFDEVMARIKKRVEAK